MWRERFLDGSFNMKKLEVFSLSMVLILLGILATSFSVKANPSEYPHLENGKVVPENGFQGTNFTFKVTYLSSENTPLADNYPKLYIDGMETGMKEKNTSDRNFVDGKVYVKTWSPGHENLGTHTFSFRAQDVFGNSIDYPDSGTLDGPTVKARTKLELSLKKKNDKLIFSGHLELVEENDVLKGENIIIYRIYSDEDRIIGSVPTSENGSFSLSTKVTEGHGISRYSAVFWGRKHYGKAESSSVYFKSFDFIFTFLIPLLVVLAILFSTGYFLNRNSDLRSHLSLIILGSLVGWILFQLFGLGLWGLLLGGAIVGYFLSREIHEWMDWLKFGSFAGIIAFSLSVLWILTEFLSLPSTMGSERGLLLLYSFTQGEFLYSLLLTSVQLFVLFVTLIAMGTVIGGYLRKFLK